jgi:hypothetical protein
MARLLLGPLLRAVDGTRATVWVETDRPCEVAVGAQRARTVTLRGHHYALVTVDGLGAATPYTVALDGQQAWPADDRFPASVLRAMPTERLTAVFGSCRSILPDERGDADRVDALREYAWRAAARPAEALPDVLVLLGDQVYADKAAPATRRFIRGRRSVEGPVGDDTHDFAEFAALYREAWSEPAVRWLLSTVPSLMVFDDHEIIDNWNTSARWLAEQQQQPWWEERVTNGLAAYWMYQHLGNLSPDEREADPCYAALAGGDEQAALEAFAQRASHGAYGTRGARWSYARDLGPARLAMIDSRDGRVLAGGRRHLLDDDEWTWLEGEARHPAPYLLLGTSLPMLLPTGAHELERLTTAACAGRWGRGLAWLAERVRRAAQFNHWAAFPPSFLRALRLLRDAAEPPRRAVLVLSGDVHYSYAAQVRAWSDGAVPAVPVHQLVSSPLCYDLYRSIAGSFRVVVSKPGEVAGRLAARAAGAPPSGPRWTIDTGPWLHNVISTLTLGPDGASVRFERTRGRGALGSRLDPVAERALV